MSSVRLFTALFLSLASFALLAEQPSIKPVLLTGNVPDVAECHDILTVDILDSVTAASVDPGEVFKQWRRDHRTMMEASPLVECQSKLWKAMHVKFTVFGNVASVPADADHLDLKPDDLAAQQLVHNFAASIGSNVDPANGVSTYQGEVQLAANPNNPLQIVAGANTFYRDPDANCQSPKGGSSQTYGTEALYGSTDGGATWTYKCAPWPASLNGGVTGAVAYYGSDPAVAWDNQGRAYAVYMLISQNSNGSFVGAAIVAARSTDSGSTWSSLGTIVNNIANPTSFDDKEMVDIDLSPGPSSTLSHPGRIYVVWDEGNVERIAHSDDGTTWTTVLLPATGIGQYSIGGDVKVGPDGTVYVIWNRLVYSGNNQTSEVNVFSKSVDGGATWSSPVSVATLALLSFGTNNTPPSQDDRGINSFGSLTLDSNSASAYFGRLYVAFSDFPSGTTSGTNTNTYVVTSTSGGTAWSPRVKVNDDTGTATQFFPWAAVDESDGTLNVAWYDTRADATNKEAQFYYARSSNGGTSFEPNIVVNDNGGSVWNNAVNYSDENSSDNASYNANQYGDYSGIIAVNRKVLPLWTDSRQFYPTSPGADTRREDMAVATIVNCSAPSSLSTPAVSIGPSCATPTVVVTWTAASGWGTNATGGTYSVYRSTTSTFPGGSPLVSGLSTTTYSDTTGIAGTAYYYFVTATNNCPGTALTPMTTVSAASASINAISGITVNPTTIPSGVMNTFYTTSFSTTGGSGAVTYGVTGTLPAGLTLSGNTLSGTPTQAGASFPITITATDATACSGSRAYTLVIALPAGSAPALLVATATGTSSVSLVWTPVAQANHYEITRSGTPGTLASAGTNSYTDAAGLSPSTTYIYRVRAIDNSSVASAYSSPDIATTIVFTDDPLVTNTTPVKSTHITELRTAVNAVRAAGGLGAFTFTDTSLAGIAIKATHISELRTALDAGRSAIGVPSLTYANTLTPGSTLIHAVDITELRNGVK
ncbi:MAG TPA: hypothetical protein VGJ81_19330 [Thermoanaerobaculia bacterium]|jgi:hypothetical protein